MKGIVTLRACHISKTYPMGAYEAYYEEDGRKKTKQRSLHVHDPVIAYETVELWAQDMAAELDLVYVPIDKKALDEAISVGSNRPYQQVSTPIKGTTLNNKLHFKGEIRRAFITTSAKRIKEVINEGLLYLDQLVKEKEVVEKERLVGKVALAKAMFEIFINNKIEMKDSIQDEEVLALYNQLKTDHA